MATMTNHSTLPVLMPKQAVKVRPNGTISSPKWDDLLDMALKGQVFALDGEMYKFVNFNSRSQKYPVVVQRTSSGEFFKTAAPIVARAFQAATK